jgi:hypothetical protein
MELNGIKWKLRNTDVAVAFVQLQALPALCKPVSSREMTQSQDGVQSSLSSELRLRTRVITFV